MRTSISFIVASLLLLSSIPAAREQTLDPRLEKRGREIASMKIAANGVSLDQAERLAKAYFQVFFGVCGGTGTPQQRGNFWIVPIVVGMNGTPSGVLRVHRFTGAVSYPRKATLYPRDYPRAFARE
jgi:hypothetical protein